MGTMKKWATVGIENPDFAFAV